MLSGYYFYTADGTKTEGSVNINNATDITISGSHTYNSGYYPTQWTVSGLDTSDADATPDKIKWPYTAYVNGVKIQGTIDQPGILSKYTGVIDPLYTATNSSWVNCGADNGVYLLFPTANGSENNATAYNVYLTRSVGQKLSSTNPIAATSISVYIIVAGTGGNSTGGVNAFDRSMTRTVLSNLSAGNPYGQRELLVGESNGYYALFVIYGYSYSTTYSCFGDSFNTSLTKSQVSSATNLGIYGGTGSNIGDYILILNGYSIQTFDKTLTKTNTSTGESGSWNDAGASGNKKHCMFAGGGQAAGVNIKTSAISFNEELTRTKATDLNNKKIYVTASNTKNYILFAGGFDQNNNTLDEVEVYDNNLTKSVVTPLHAGRRRMCHSTKISNYAIFAGGDNTVWSTIDAYYES